MKKIVLILLVVVATLVVATSCSRECRCTFSRIPDYTSQSFKEGDTNYYRTIDTTIYITIQSNQRCKDFGCYNH
jgi:branched-subunit amino acid permease